MAVLGNKKPAVEASQRRDSNSARVDLLRTAYDPAFAYRHDPGWHWRPDSRTQRRVGSSRRGMSGEASWLASPVARRQVTRYRRNGGKSSSPGQKGLAPQVASCRGVTVNRRPAREDLRRSRRARSVRCPKRFSGPCSPQTPRTASPGDAPRTKDSSAFAALARGARTGDHRHCRHTRKSASRMPFLKGDPLRMCVDIEPPVSEESGERHPDLVGQVHGERAGG